jgi:hypothetical protein
MIFLSRSEAGIAFDERDFSRPLLQNASNFGAFGVMKM